MIIVTVKVVCDLCKTIGMKETEKIRKTPKIEFMRDLLFSHGWISGLGIDICPDCRRTGITLAKLKELLRKTREKKDCQGGDLQ